MFCHVSQTRNVNTLKFPACLENVEMFSQKDHFETEAPGLIGKGKLGGC